LERGQQLIEHLVDGLLRGEIQARYEAYAVARQNGWMSTNDIREKENMNPVPGGDTYIVQSAMVPLDRLDDVIDAQIRPKIAPTSAEPPEDDRDALIRAIAEDLKADAELTRHGAQSHHQAVMERLSALPTDLPPPPPSVVVPEPAIATITERVDELGEQIARTVAGLAQQQQASVAADVARLEATVQAGQQAMIERLALSTEPPLQSEPVVEVMPDPAIAEEVTHALAEVDERLTQRLDTLCEEVTSRIATAQELGAWQEETIALIAGQLVRREIAKAKKALADPDHGVESLRAFYLRFVDDAARDLAPWAKRMRPEGGVAVVRDRLAQWSEAGLADCMAALTNGGLPQLLLRWVERHGDLTRALVEVLHG
jgi:tetrahydromethanopterin S-methyltransferase subunit G